MNLLYRMGYRVAYRLLQAWWLVRRPQAHGAAVAVWQGERLLVVRTSYRPRLDLPGGGIERAETALAAAVRELREETGLRAVTDELTEAGSYHFEDNRRHITAHVFAWRPGAPAAAHGGPARDRLGRVSRPRAAGWPATDGAARALSGRWQSCSPGIASGAERYPPDVARVVAHRAVAGEPAHVGGIQHGLWPPRRRGGIGLLDLALGCRIGCRSRP